MRRAESTAPVDARAEAWPYHETRFLQVDWSTHPRRYRVRVRLVAEAGGGFSARVLELPGVISEGDTEADAIEHAKEALVGCLEAYFEAGEAVPWNARPDATNEGDNDHWVVVDA